MFGTPASLCFFFLMMRRPPNSTFFPYPPLFRSEQGPADFRPAAGQGEKRVRYRQPDIVQHARRGFNGEGTLGHAPGKCRAVRPAFRHMPAAASLIVVFPAAGKIRRSVTTRLLTLVRHLPGQDFADLTSQSFPREWLGQKVHVGVQNAMVANGVRGVAG